jgi:hypothetical protein
MLFFNFFKPKENILVNDCITFKLNKKKTKMVLGLSLIAISGLILVAADHVDAPSVTGNAADITDLYTSRDKKLII